MGYDPDACILCTAASATRRRSCSARRSRSRGAGATRASSRPGSSRGSTPSASSAAAASPSARPARSTRSSRRARRARSASSSRSSTTCTFCGVGCQIDLNRRSGDEAHRQGHVEGRVPPERGQPLRQGPLRLQLRAPPRPSDTAARPRRGRRAPSDVVGARARDRGLGPEEGRRRARAAGDRRPRPRPG